MILPSEFAEKLGLETLSPEGREKPVPIDIADLCHPGLQFAGYFDTFANERPQIIGKTEMGYLTSLDAPVRKIRLIRYFSYDMPCVIISRSMDCPPDFLERAGQAGVPVYRTDEMTSKFAVRALEFLTRVLAPGKTCHGVLMSIFGAGVLITGESGVGKSECALELIKRGHALVADDVVEVTNVNGRLFGEANEMVRDFMELRGIGIVDVRMLFGIGAVERRSRIDLVIHLSRWDPSVSYDRLGNEDLHENILGVQVPLIEMPVRSGRNLAIIIETATRNWLLQKDGYSATRELDRRLRRRYAAENGSENEELEENEEENTPIMERRQNI